MSKALLLIGGILNSLFFVIHVLLGYQLFHLTQLAPPFRGLIEALNVGGVLFILFFAYASFFYGQELLSTGLGKAVLLLASVLYLSRAAEEFFWLRFTPAIFALCVIVGAIYAALLVIAIRQGHVPQQVSIAAGPTELRRAA